MMLVTSRGIPSCKKPLKWARVLLDMNIEDYRSFCLSLGDDVEEKMPFTAFHFASGVLVFYVRGHMFSFFDCDDFSVITLKCQPTASTSFGPATTALANPLTCRKSIGSA